MKARSGWVADRVCERCIGTGEVLESFLLGLMCLNLLGGCVERVSRQLHAEKCGKWGWDWSVWQHRMQNRQIFESLRVGGT